MELLAGLGVHAMWVWPGEVEDGGIVARYHAKTQCTPRLCVCCFLCVCATATHDYVYGTFGRSFSLLAHAELKMKWLFAVIFYYTIIVFGLCNEQNAFYDADSGSRRQLPTEPARQPNTIWTVDYSRS